MTKSQTLLPEMSLRIILATAAMLLVAAIQLLAGLRGNNWMILVAGALLCLLPHGLWMLLESRESHVSDVYLPGVATVTGILLGSIVRFISQPPDKLVVDLLAVIFGATGSALITFLRIRQRRQRCELCGHHLTRGHQICPRCDQAVCELSTCWNAEYYRCSDCEWLQRPLLTLKDEIVLKLVN